MNYVHRIGKWTKIFGSTYSILHRILLVEMQFEDSVNADGWKYCGHGWHVGSD